MIKAVSQVQSCNFNVCLMLTCVCVDVLCICLLIECVFAFAGWSKGSRGGGWGCLDLISQDVLCVFGNLTFSLLRQWGEHVRLWHMEARVTCSPCPHWTVGLWSKTSPPLWLLHCFTCLPALCPPSLGTSLSVFVDVESCVSDRFLFCNSLFQFLVQLSPLLLLFHGVAGPYE